MPRMVLAYKIPPNIKHKIEKFFTLLGADGSTWKDDLVKVLTSVGIQHQSWYMPATEAGGAVFISVWEAADPMDALNKFVSSQHPFAAELKEHFRMCSGSGIDQQVPAVQLNLPVGPASLVFEIQVPPPETSARGRA